MQFTNTIYFNEVIIAAMPLIGSVTTLFSTLANELVTKAHVDREIVNLKLANIYLHRIDWLLSGDDGEDSFHSRLQQELLNLTPTISIDS